MDPSPSLTISQLILTNAVLAYLSPECTVLDAIIRLHACHRPADYRPPVLRVPVEILLHIRSFLAIAIVDALYDGMMTYALSAVEALCDDCKQYNTYIYGDQIYNWPYLDLNGCRCNDRLSLSEAPAKLNKLPDNPSYPKYAIAGKPWYQANLLTTAQTYLVTNPSSPYAHQLTALVERLSFDDRAPPTFEQAYFLSAEETFLSDVLSALHCRVSFSRPRRSRGDMCVVKPTGLEDDLFKLRSELSLGSIKLNSVDRSLQKLKVTPDHHECPEVSGMRTYPRRSVTSIFAACAMIACVRITLRLFL